MSATPSAREWIQIEAVMDRAPDDWSLFADAFTEAGCSSSVQTDHPPTIRGYLEGVPGAEAASQELRQRLLSLGACEVTLSTLPDEDWSEVWKAFFKPHRVGKRFMIVPSWELYNPLPDDVVIQLDPGQAFGTGEHPTTQLCLELLERAEPRRRSVLDLGCGSGILAIAAAKCGAGQVAAADIEPAAVEIARENAARNEVEVELYAGAGFGDWAAGRTWDIVLSNIISATLIRLAPEARKYVAEQGRWIVSGVLQSNWPDVRAACESADFELEAFEVRDEWVGATFLARGFGGT